jgi:hypothetical protein
MEPDLAEQFVRGAIKWGAFAVILIVGALALRGIGIAWRWLRSRSLAGTARAAGSLTAIAKRKADEAAKSFKDGFHS